MEIVNETKAEAGWTMGFQRDGREILIVVVKATFDMPAKPDEEPCLSDEQAPLIEADEFTGDPGFSAPLYESDYAHQKPFCDVLFNGKAYAPGKRPEKRIPVSVQVGEWSKTFAVTGERFWQGLLVTARPSDPEPFSEMPISYDNAFGGVDDSDGDPNDVKTFLRNPIGKGYVDHLSDIDGMPLCNTEEVGNPIKSPRGKYNPMALGPIGRSWAPRYTYAGTYDDEWIENQSPFLPEDFDLLYFQAAPQDQQIMFPQGGEQITLTNLTLQGKTRFLLPIISMPVIFVPHKGQDIIQKAVIDTLHFEPELNRFSMVWRTALVLDKSFFDIKQMIVGEMPASWHRERKAAANGKAFYRGLGEYIRTKKGKV